ncbi:MAG: sigma-70 family RNA polymerase sigma factor [Actinomycetota bacterium]|nr:sigma-70 family RNA polymerase sigma factor [Actinomycetota bacterium]
MDDSTLVQRAVEGDKEAFGAIYDHYAPRLQAFLWWVLQDGERATEVLFDTFQIAGSRLHQLTDPSRLRPWLYAIAAREAVEADRSKTPDDEADSTGVEDDSANEFVSVVRAGAEELNARDRALLDLRFRQRLKDRELGDALGVKAESADAIVQRVADRAEHLLGPTLAIRFSTKNCPELMAIVGTNLGPLDTRTRRKAEEHVDRCPTCDNWRRRITVATLLSAAPTPPPPPDLRQRVLDDVQLAAYDGRPWSRRRNGFPPPLVSEHTDERLRRAVMAAAAAVIVGVVLVGALILARDDRSGEQVASVGSTTTSTRPRPATTVATTVPVTSTTVLPGEATGGGGTGGGTSGAGTSATTAPRGSATQQTGNLTPTSPRTAPAPEPEPEPTTEAPEPTTTLAPDSEGPSLSGLSISPSTVGCGGTATVSVHASDPSGIDSVVAVPALPGGHRVPMTGGGGSYSATVGPFSASSLPAGTDLPGAVVVQAVDGAGNESAVTGPITLRCSSD